MTLEPLTLRPNQAAAVARIAEEFTCAAIVPGELGSGKTVVSVEVSRSLNARQTLVFGPKSTRLGWERTVLRQGLGPFYFLNNKNKAGKDAQALLKAGEPGFYFATRDWARLQDWRRLAPKGVDLYIQDECHTLANRKSKGVRSIQHFYNGAVRAKLDRRYTLLLSGTPWGSTFEGAYSVSQIAWPELVDPSFPRWREQWCETEYANYSPDKVGIKGEKIPGAYAESLPCYVRLEAPVQAAPIEEDIWVPLLPKQEALYRQFEHDGFVWLQENPLAAELPIVKRIRLRQLLLGVASIRPGTRRKRDKETGEMYTETYDQVYFEEDAESAKLDALQEFIEDHPDESLLISTDSQRFAEIVAKRIGGFEHTGKVSDQAREQAREDFEHGRLKHLVVHPGTVADGTNGLQENCHILVILSDSDNLVTNVQLVGRLRRPGQKKQVVVVKIRTANTIDDDQAETLLNRELHMRASTLADRPHDQVA